MPITTRAVIAAAKGAPVRVEEVVIPDPGPGEVLVRLQACGVCHTDLLYREGGVNDEFPFFLGHEAAGIVEAVGDGVVGGEQGLEEGDFVVLAWRAPCGRCRACRKGAVHYCFNSQHETQPATLADGTVLSPALGLGAFASHTLVGAGGAVKVNPEAGAAAAGLLGCGVMAGYGAMVNTGGIRAGESAAVIGCGGVGNAAIAGAALNNASTIIAVDVDDRKLEWAREFGATHTVNSREVDPIEAIRDLTDGNGADVVVEAVGRPETLTQAYYARDLAGRAVLVGVPSPEMTWEVPMIDIFSRGGSLKSSWYGDCLPTRDFPILVDSYLAGRFPLGKFVTETIPLDDVEAAFHRMEAGEVLRSVVDLSGEGA